MNYSKYFIDVNKVRQNRPNLLTRAQDLANSAVCDWSMLQYVQVYPSFCPRKHSLFIAKLALAFIITRKLTA